VEVHINSHAMRWVSAKIPQNLIKIEELYSATLIESIKGRMLEFLTDKVSSSHYPPKYL
jgi:hypothetical protein